MEQTPPPRRSTRLLALGAVVAAAGLLRTLFADALPTPTHHAALASTLALHELLDQRSLAELIGYWASLLSSFQGLSLVERSAAVLPVNALVYAVTGPVLGHATLAGALWGTAAVALAYAVGRQVAGARTALWFAALVAVSPMQLVWSRIGGLYVTAVPMVLGTLWVTLACVERRSVGLALLAGLCGWTTLYGYYAARIAIPLSLWAILTWDAPAPRWVRARLLVAWIVPWLAGYAVWGHGVLETFWPLVGFGNFPEPRVVPVLGASLATAADSAARTLRLLFVAGRAAPWEGFGWGLRFGGAIPLPVALLGALGLARMARHLRRQQLWLVLLALSLLPAALSSPEIRRLLVFDAAWQLAAAVGLDAVVGWATLRGLPRARVLAATGVAALGVWSLTAILLLTAAPAEELAPIPFGVGTRGESSTCRGCAWRLRHWQRAVEAGQVVVVFDGDTTRDARQFHLRTDGYAQLAALGAGHEDGVWDFQAFVGNARVRMTRAAEPLAADGDWRVPLERALAAPWAREACWYFEDPTARERQAIAELAAAGGRVRRLRAPYETADTKGPRWALRAGGEIVEVTTPVSDRARAIAIVARNLAPRDEAAARIAATLVGARSLPEPAVDLLRDAGGGERRPWRAVMRASVEVDGGTRVTPPLRAGIAGAHGPHGAPVLVATGGRVFSWADGGGMIDEETARDLLPIGHRCAAVAADGAWWVVDAVTGGVRSHADVSWLPRRRWVGIVRAGRRIVLAAAGGDLALVDPARRSVEWIGRVPVWSGPRRDFGECSTLLAGDGWYGTWNYASGHGALMAGDGTSLGTLDAKAVLGAPARIDAVDAWGDTLAVAYADASGIHLARLRIEAP